MNLVDELARKAKELTADMQSRLNRLPDIADYRAAFRAILDSHPDIAQAIADRDIRLARRLTSTSSNATQTYT